MITGYSIGPNTMQRNPIQVGQDVLSIQTLPIQDGILSVNQPLDYISNLTDTSMSSVIGGGMTGGVMPTGVIQNGMVITVNSTDSNINQIRSLTLISKTKNTSTYKDSQTGQVYQVKEPINRVDTDIITDQTPNVLSDRGNIFGITPTSTQSNVSYSRPNLTVNRFGIGNDIPTYSTNTSSYRFPTNSFGGINTTTSISTSISQTGRSMITNRFSRL